MKIEWQEQDGSGWSKEEKERFIECFENKIWPDFYHLLDKQLVNALGVNLYETLSKDVNARIDFEVHPQGSIKICVFPWICTNKPETICDAWGDKDDRKSPWLIGSYDKKD